MSLIGENPGIPRLAFSEETHLGNREVADFLPLRLGYYVETISAVMSAADERGSSVQGFPFLHMNEHCR